MCWHYHEDVVATDRVVTVCFIKTKTEAYPGEDITIFLTPIIVFHQNGRKVNHFCTDFGH